MLNPCDSWTTLVTVQLQMSFQLTRLLKLLCASIGLHFTLHSIIMDMAHSGGVAKTTHDITRHDSADMY